MNFQKTLNNNFLLAFFSSIVIFMLLFLWTQSFFYPLDLKFRDTVTSVYSKKDVNKDIILVKVDDNTTKKLGWPIDKEKYIKVVENLKKSWAKVVAFDIFFSDNKNEESEKLLSLSFKKSENIIIWWKVEKKWRNINFENPIFLDEIFSEKLEQKKLKNKVYKNSVEKIWYYNPTINWRTRKVYWLIPYTQLKNWIKIEHLAFTATREFLKKDTKILWYNKEKNIYNFLDDKIPVKNKQFFIKYQKSWEFKSESFLNVYNWAFKKDFFKDKLVFIGYTEDWTTDEYEVPEIWKIKWVYIILNTVNNILNKTYIKFFNKNIEIIIIFLLTFLIIYFTISKESLSQIKWLFFWAFMILIISFIIYIIIYMNYLQTKNIYFFPNFPIEFLSAIILWFFSSTIFKYLKEDKNKKLLNEALWEYVSKDIAKEILSWEWKINLDWEKKDISIFFSDIEWFTSISEKLDAKELVGFLQKYLWNMSEIIMDQKWFIDKYEWDAIMALWGIFWESGKTKSFDILESAILQQKKLFELNKEFKTSLWEELKVRMWIHIWEAIIWNIWAKWKKMEFTALWDNVNLASRLEWVNKFYWTYICCSEEIVKIEKNNFEFRFLDNIKVKWKNNWVKIFELLWKKWEISEKVLEKRKIFEEALEFYFKKDFEKAIELFEKSERLLDKPSTIFIFRCKYFLKNPPVSSWDWVWQMKEK